MVSDSWQLVLENLVILPAWTVLSCVIILVMGLPLGILLVWVRIAFHSSGSWRIELSPFSSTLKPKRSPL